MQAEGALTRLDTSEAKQGLQELSVSPFSPLSSPTSLSCGKFISYGARLDMIALPGTECAACSSNPFGVVLSGISNGPKLVSAVHWACI